MTAPSPRPDTAKSGDPVQSAGRAQPHGHVRHEAGGAGRNPRRVPADSDARCPGLQVCEHLPQTARWMHRASLIRTVTHNYNAHNPLAMVTGYAGGENAQITAKNTDPPDIGAICQYLGKGIAGVPGAVCMPCYPGLGRGHPPARALWRISGPAIRSVLLAVQADVRPQAARCQLRPGAARSASR